MDKNKPLRCPLCGGEFSLDDLLDDDGIVTCLNCGSKYNADKLLDKDTLVQIEEIKARFKRGSQKDRLDQEVKLKQLDQEARLKQLDQEVKLEEMKNAEKKREDKNRFIAVGIGFAMVILAFLFLLSMLEAGYY